VECLYVLKDFAAVALVSLMPPMLILLALDNKLLLVTSKNVKELLAILLFQSQLIIEFSLLVVQLPMVMLMDFLIANADNAFLVLALATFLMMILLVMLVLDLSLMIFPLNATNLLA
jgi:hypothetical protein